ncbi:Uncharacterised protein [Vibrio cholerae]|uniref:Uncharacterized protein n=1 Tax=Vibrio cholerae TaxID=666 RepID=A0A655YAX4_VIBCL|nr:Uncharacterised protein [Vibrio cholerae]CSC33328.1 Uncharacterised protein [Vibrio cholerae]
MLFIDRRAFLLHYGQFRFLILTRFAIAKKYRQQQTKNHPSCGQNHRRGNLACGDAFQTIFMQVF